MRRAAVTGLLALALIGCEAQREVELPPEQVKALFRTRGCTNCHDRARPLVGPSFADIAARHAGDPRAVEVLTESLRRRENADGSRPMAALHQRLDEHEARAMARWILDL